MSSRNYKKSQHFLRSPRVAHEVIGHSPIKRRDTVVDLGAGSGVITGALAERCESVIAVENDTLTFEKLRKNVASYNNVSIIDTDILTYRPPMRPYKIVANIPFSLSAKIVERYTHIDDAPQSMSLIVQRQFARKLVPGTDHFTSKLAAQIGPWWHVKIRMPLKRHDFTPPPAVDTVLVELTKRPESWLPIERRESYDSFVERCFSRQAFFQQRDRAKAGINPEKRPSQLSLDEWVRLFSIQY